MYLQMDAKKLRNAMRDCDNGENSWDLIVDKCVEELSDNYGYDKIHRFWAKKELFQQDVESEIIEEIRKDRPYLLAHSM